MRMIYKLKNFLKYIISKFHNGFIVRQEIKSLTIMEDDKLLTDGNDSNSLSLQNTLLPEEGDRKLNISKRALTNKFYVLKQEIKIFKNDFPKEYFDFLEKIEELEEKYNLVLQESIKPMTFEIDPELDNNLRTEVKMLENSIRRFINSEVKFSILSKRGQELIVKLNILYNISIEHKKEKEKQKVLSRIEEVLNLEQEMIKDFKDNDYLTNDPRKKDRIITLFSYADYQVLKLSIRCSNFSLEEIIDKFPLLSEFYGFDFKTAFRAFVQDELSDLLDKLGKISDERFRKSFSKQIEKLLTDISCNDFVLNQNFWNRFLAMESSIIEVLNQNKSKGEKYKVNILEKMDISISESEVLTLPKTNAYIALTLVFSITGDERILILIKLFDNLNDKITYKEIYFLFLLFDVLSVLKRYSSEFMTHFEKYEKKYSYDSNSIRKKKEALMNSNVKKEYLLAFSLGEEDDSIVSELENLNIDFIVQEDNIYISSFYFNELENVMNSLRNATCENG